MSSKPYRVTWQWGDWETFATFEEALAFRNEKHPGWHISNSDHADGEGDGLTPEEHEAAL